MTGGAGFVAFFRVSLFWAISSLLRVLQSIFFILSNEVKSKTSKKIILSESNDTPGLTLHLHKNQLVSPFNLKKLPPSSLLKRKGLAQLIHHNYSTPFSLPLDGTRAYFMFSKEPLSGTFWMAYPIGVLRYSNIGVQDKAPPVSMTNWKKIVNFKCLNFFAITIFHLMFSPYLNPQWNRFRISTIIWLVS